jgi:hypothetical protein
VTVAAEGGGFLQFLPSSESGHVLCVSAEGQRLFDFLKFVGSAANLLRD